MITWMQIKREHENLLKVIRDRDTHLKLFRRLTTSLNNIKMAIPTIQTQKDELRRQMHASQADEKYQKNRLAEIRKDIDICLFDFIRMEKVEKSEAEKVKDMVMQNHDLMETLNKVTAQTNELQHQVDEGKTERDLKARDVIRITSKVKSIKDEAEIRDASLADDAKRLAEGQQRVKDSATMYELVKNERNKYVSFLFTYTGE